MRSFRQAVTDACEVADVLVLVGDIFDRPDPPPGALVTLAQGLETIRSAIPETQVCVYTQPLCVYNYLRLKLCSLKGQTCHQHFGTTYSPPSYLPCFAGLTLTTRGFPTAVFGGSWRTGSWSASGMVSIAEQARSQQT